MRERRGVFRLVLSTFLLPGAGALRGPMAQSPPPAPELTKVSPDRVAAGDLVTLTGKNFLPPGAPSPSVIVRFGTAPVAIVPDSDTSLSTPVPNGAKSGPVTVTTAVSVNGQIVEQTSNTADILVIWKEFVNSVNSGDTILNS